MNERNFCERCGKRLGGEGHIHTCTPPAAQPAVPLTDAQIQDTLTKAIKAGELSWLGYQQDENGYFTIPALSQQHYQIARAIEAAHGITAAPEKGGAT
jgi:hypothetical protein